MTGTELTGAVRPAVELTIGIVLAGGTVALLRHRWRPPASRGGRTWRAAVITVVAVLVGLAWPVVITLAIVAVVAALIGLLGRPSPRPPATPHPYPAGQRRPRGHRCAPDRGRSAEDEYWDQRARSERDQHFAAQYEADMYRWGHRHHPPPGY